MFRWRVSDAVFRSLGSGGTAERLDAFEETFSAHVRARAHAFRKTTEDQTSAHQHALIR